METPTNGRKYDGNVTTSSSSSSSTFALEAVGDTIYSDTDGINNILPAEVLENIFKYVFYDAYKPSTAWNIRLVCWLWAKHATKVLQDICKNKFVSHLQPYHLPGFINTPMISVVPGSNPPTVMVPSYLVTSVDDGSGTAYTGNPFPTKTLVVVGNKPNSEKNTQSSSSLKFGELAMHNLLKMFGSNLTSLTIHGIRITTRQLEDILGLTLNLKGLSITDVEWECKEPDPSPSIVGVPLKSLSYIRVTGITNIIETYSGLLSHYLPRLELVTTLEIDSTIDVWQRWREDWNVKHLKFYALDYMYPFNPVKIPLLTLTIKDVYKPTLTGFQSVFAFVCIYAQTLQKLHFEVRNWANPQRFRYEASATIVAFPMLKLFACPFPREDEEVELLRKVLLPSFRALEVLELLNEVNHYPRLSDEEENTRITEFLNAQQYKKICPDLVDIFVYQDGQKCRHIRLT